MLQMISTIKMILFFELFSWYFFGSGFSKNSGIAFQKSLDKKIYQEQS